MVRDLSLTFPKEVRDSTEVTRSRDSAEVTRSRRGYERWRLPTKEGGGAPKERSDRGSTDKDAQAGSTVKAESLRAFSREFGRLTLTLTGLLSSKPLPVLARCGQATTYL